ncbi:DNase I-like protein, partial [Artomyces pyxidatus]
MRHFLTVSDRFCMFNVGTISQKAFWKILKSRLVPEVLEGIVRVLLVRQPNGRPRMDFWVQRRVSGDIKNALYMKARHRREGTKVDYQLPLYKLKKIWKPNAETSAWRLDMYRNWRDRPLTAHPLREEDRLTRPRLVMTLNVNGLNGKMAELQQLLADQTVAVAAIQETLIRDYDYLLKFNDYTVYSRPATKGFRGQALLVHKSYPSYVASDNGDGHYLHVRVARLHGGAPWHIIAVYLPSGGNTRSERTRSFTMVKKLYKQILAKEKDAKILVLGDFNLPRHMLEKRIDSERSGMQCVEIRGSNLTFHRANTKWSAIDHMIASPWAKTLLTHARVQREWSTSSDHFPLTSTFRGIDPDQELDVPPVRYRFDTDLIKGHAKDIVFSNRWQLLPTDPIEDAEELNDSVETFTSIITETAIDAGIKKQVLRSKPYWNRHLKRFMARLSHYKKEYA